MLLVLVSLLGAIASAQDAPAPGKDWNTFFPDGLVNAQGQPVSPDTLNGKKVFLYFASASCGPCHAFCPKLIEFRNRYKDQMEVVFVSQDPSEQTQLKYMQNSQMPWPAAKWHDYKLADGNLPRTLMSNYQGWGTPSIAVLSKTGELESQERADWVPQEIKHLPEEEIGILQKESDSFDLAFVQKEAMRLEHKELSDDEAQQRLDLFKGEIQKRIAEIQALDKGSRDFTGLGPTPTWNDLLFDYYQFLRQKPAVPAP
jgi:thiol-disulfide isomerase/thioredoxin